MLLAARNAPQALAAPLPCFRLPATQPLHWSKLQNMIDFRPHREMPSTSRVLALLVLCALHVSAVDLFWGELRLIDALSYSVLSWFCRVMSGPRPASSAP